MKVVFLFVFILSLALCVRLFLFFQNADSYKAGDILDTSVTLLQEPRIQFDKQIFRASGMRIEAPILPEIHYGDTFFLKGEVVETVFTSKNGEEVKFLSVKDPQIIIITTQNPFVNSTAFIRERVWEVFSKIIPRNEAGLLFGILFGGTQGFSASMRESFVNTGVLHVVAASGMNVTMVAGFLFAITSRFLNRRVSILISVLGIFYYALLAGFEPSILRASIMASLVFSAAFLGRQNWGFLMLIITVFIMLMIRPDNALDVGFLLSVSSTAGILFIKPFLDSFQIAKATKGFSDDITTTISAQLASLPFLGSFFSSYSLISVFVNALVLWTIPFLMVLGGIASIMALIMPVLAFIPLYIALPLLWYFEKMVGFFASTPLLQMEHVPWVMWGGYYLILFAIMLKLYKK